MKPEREWASQRVIAPPEPATPKFEKRHILYEKLRLGTIYGGFGYFGSLKDFAVPGVAGGGIRSHHTLVVDAEAWPMVSADGAIHARSFRPTTGVSSLLTHADLA